MKLITKMEEYIMKNLPKTSTRSTTNNVSLNVIPSDFEYVEIRQTMGAETTVNLTLSEGLSISHKCGNKLVFRGQKS